MFDLVVLDLNMPIADGYEACSNILKLFRQEMLFEQSEIAPHNQIDSKQDNKPPINNKSKKQKINKALLSKYIPHLVAVTAYIDEDIKHQVKKQGFKDLFLIPMST